MSSFPPPNGTFQPGSAANATSLVELSMSAKNLKDLDVFSKSDPMCVVFIKPFGSNQFVELKRTEVIRNCLDPEFVTKATLSYFFEEQQHLKFELYDMDNESRHLSDHDFLGRCQCTVAQIVAAGTLTLPLENPEQGTNCGQLTISSEELSSCKDELELQFIAKSLDKMDWFGSSDPFLQFSKANESGVFSVVHRTEHISNNINPVWTKFQIPIRTLCNGDLDRNIKVECYDHNRSGKHSFIGQFFITCRQLMKGPGEENIFACVNQKKQTKKNYKNSGLVHLVHCEVRKCFSFLDYIQGGTDLACTMAIDFTASNGNPNTPSSLHYISPGGQFFNQYELAIQSVGTIVEEYDSDKLFPVLGFGARLPPDGRVSHMFFVNGHDSNPYCDHVAGVLQAYKSCLPNIQLYGPTNFSPVINHVADIARNFRDGSQYFILLIITDGIITDMPQTKSSIVAASDLPLSIIIVGVGEADFEAMEELDGDTVRLTSPTGKVASRDIVQFVPFRNFMRPGTNPQTSRIYLAKEVLAEIPEQFLSYMKINKIGPKQPVNGATKILPSDPEALLQS